MNKTALYSVYEKKVGKWTNFAGWQLPLEFTGILREHKAVRERAGLFDVSHMGRIEVKGPDALTFLNSLVTNELEREANVIYTPLCFPSGGTADDLLVYRFNSEHLLLVTNAVNKERVLNLLRERHHRPGLGIHDRTADTAQLALQGPAAGEMMEKIAPAAAKLKPFRAERVSLAGFDQACLVSRTGYTGEDGFELYVSAAQAAMLWNLLLDVGRDFELLPAGLGARDLLRLEAGLPLYGHELSPDISPLQAGLERFIKWEKPRFEGKEALLAQKNRAGLARRVGLMTFGRSVIPRAGCDVIYEGKLCGKVTSGNYSPALEKGIAMALVSPVLALGTDVKIRLRGKEREAVVSPLPFYKREGKIRTTIKEEKK